jgi:cytidine deaminase
MPDLSQETIDRLVEAASAVRDQAHAPYSGFAVGAAILDANGHVHVGCNVENASYGLSVCAERHAIFGDFPVILANPAGERIVTNVRDLLPDAFTPDSLLER